MLNMDNPYKPKVDSSSDEEQKKSIWEPPAELASATPTLNGLFINEARKAIEKEIARLQSILMQL